jgi:aryl-alcohol dehydrogenase-like predicted oxidoreductase
VSEGLGVITYFSLAAGFLTGKYRSPADLSKSPRGQLVGKYLDARGERILRALDAVARSHQAAVAQVALAWLMVQPGVTAPIASASSLEQLEILIGATALSLSGEELQALTAASN